MTIKVGDLVVVVRNPECGCESKHLGFVFEVETIDEVTTCIYCKTKDGYPQIGFYGRGGEIRIGRGRLKKIPPLDELEREDRKEELTA